MTLFDCTADLVGQLGNGQKGMLQIDASLLKISGYATGSAGFAQTSQVLTTLSIAPTLSYNIQETLFPVPCNADAP